MSRDGVTGEERSELLARFAAQAERGLKRISCEVAGEQVTFTHREGRVQVLCTCAAHECEHYLVALGFLGEHVDLSSAPAPRLRSSLRPPPLDHNKAQVMAEAFEELCLATARAGVNMQDSPSIRAALDQLLASATQPASLSLSRFIGRFNSALATGEVGTVARLLAGVQSWAHDLKRGEHARETVARTRSWLGDNEGDALASLTDATLVELGREWLAGLTRSAIERRYLVDLVSGALFTEERRRGEQDISVGPCPRVVHVAFAELDTALSPPRARLLQYTVTHEPSEAQWQRLSELGEPSLPTLLSQYAQSARSCPSLSEPAVLFAPRELSAGPTGSLRDAHGTRLELRDDSDAPLADTVRALAAEGELVWVLGRLRGLLRGIVLRPTSLLVRVDGKLRLRRIT